MKNHTLTWGYTLRCFLGAYCLPLAVICVPATLTACAKPEVPVRVQVATPPASRLVCPDEPSPPGKPGEPVTDAEDFAWQEGRDQANATCRTNMHWLRAFFADIVKRVSGT